MLICSPHYPQWNRTLVGGKRQQLMDIAPAPDLGCQGNFQPDLRDVQTLPSRVPSFANPHLNCPGEKSLQGSLGWKDGKHLAFTPPLPCGGPHTLSIAQIWGWGQPSGQILETGG